MLFIKKPKFSNENFINWLNKIGIETYIGSSGRVFPVKGIKPIDILNALINIIHQKEINLFNLATLSKFKFHDNFDKHSVQSAFGLESDSLKLFEPFIKQIA